MNVNNGTPIKYTNTSGLSKEVYNFVLPQGAQKLPAKVQIKSPIYTILLSKSDFSFALLLVTFELLEVEQSYIPLLKALMCGINAVGAQGCGCMFTFCHAYLKMGVLLHKMAIVCNQTFMAVGTTWTYVQQFLRFYTRCVKLLVLYSL